MKVLFISTTSATAKAFLLPLAKYLRQKGYDISFACSFKSYPDTQYAVDKLMVEGFAVHEIEFSRNISFFKDIKSFFQLAKLIKENRYQVVHSFTSKAGFIGRLCGKYAGCPNVLYTVLGYEYLRYNGGIKRWFYLYLEKFGSYFCDRQLFCSEFLMRETIQYKLINNKKMAFVGLIYNSLALIKNADDGGPFVRKKYGFDKDELLVGSVGRLVQQKGMETFIKAAAIVSNENERVRFLVIGDGPLRPKLETLVQSLGLTERFKFLGYLPIEEVMQIMPALDLFVLSTRFEGFGTVYLHAMASGCAVIGSRISPVKEIIKEGETGLLAEMDNVNDFARAIIQLLANPELREIMGSRGPEYVERNFSLQPVLDNYEKIYRDIKEKGIKG